MKKINIIYSLFYLSSLDFYIIFLSKYLIRSSFPVYNEEGNPTINIQIFYIHMQLFRSRSWCDFFSQLLFPLHLLLCSHIGFPFIAIEWPEGFVVNIDVHIDDTVYSRFALHCPLWILRFAIPIPREAYRPAQLNQGRVIGVRVAGFDLPSPLSQPGQVIEVLLYADGSHPGRFHSAELARVIRNRALPTAVRTNRSGPVRFNLSFHRLRLSKNNAIFVSFDSREV